MSGRPVHSFAALKDEVDSGDYILLGPEGEPARAILKRNRRGHYVVQSGDRQQSFTCRTWAEAGEALLKLTGPL